MSQGLQLTRSTSSSTDGGGIAFGFNATRVTLINTGASAAVFVNFTTTSGATTGDWPVIAGSSEQVTLISQKGGYFTGLSHVSTSGAAPTFRVLAIAL